jgi:hypothetical protein
MTERAMGITRACGLVGISRSLFRYESQRGNDEELTQRMTAIAAQKRRLWLSSHPRPAASGRLAGQSQANLAALQHGGAERAQAQTQTYRSR